MTAVLDWISTIQASWLRSRADPSGLAWTGDRRYITPWTTFGGPVVTVNVGADNAGLPIGALLAGPPGTDAHFSGIAHRLAEVLEV